MLQLLKRVAAIVFAVAVIGGGYYLWPQFRQAFAAYVWRNEIGDPDCNGMKTKNEIEPDGAPTRCPRAK